MSDYRAFLEEAKTRITVSELIRSYIPIVKSGPEYKACCPFHNEKTPSFTINDEKGFYHCFGCSAHGDILKFIMEYERLDYLKALEKIATKVGMTLVKSTKKQQEVFDKIKHLHNLMEYTNKLFMEELRKTENLEIYKYVTSRGLSNELIKKFEIGFAPHSSDWLQNKVLPLRYTAADMLEVGLLAESENKKPIDKFRRRLMIPIKDLRDNVIGFGGRVMGDGQPKYLNSPETIFFKKRNILYNYNNARKEALKQNKIYIVEGYFDVFALTQIGFENVVAPMGTALTNEQMQLLWGEELEIVLCLDGDEAGQRAINRIIEHLVDFIKPGNLISFVVLPKDKDPADMVAANAQDELRNLLNKPNSLSEIIWYFLTGSLNLDLPEDRLVLSKRLNLLCAKIKDAEVRENYQAYFRNRLYVARYNKSKGKHEKRTTLTATTHNFSNLDRAEISFVYFVGQNLDLLVEYEKDEVFSSLDLQNEIVLLLRDLILEKNSSEALEKVIIDNNIKAFVADVALEINDEFKKNQLWNYYINTIYIEKMKLELETYMKEVTNDATEKAKFVQREIADLRATNSEIWLEFQGDS